MKSLKKAITNSKQTLDILKWDGNTWNTYGIFPSDSSTNQYYHGSIAMDSTGHTIANAISDYQNTENLVKVYTFNGMNWVPKGGPIHSINPQLVESDIKLSADGNRIAIGCKGKFPQKNGYVRVFEWNGSSWVQMGATLSNPTVFSFANSIDLDNRGNTLIVTGPNSIWGTGSNDQVWAYEWNGRNWVQKGNGLISTNITQFFGSQADLSGDGNSIVVSSGVTNNNKTEYRVGVYEFSNNDWELKGQEIFEGVNDNQKGTQVKMDALILRLATQSTKFQ